MSEPDPDAHLIATRQAIERWLHANPGDNGISGPLAANTYTLWAMTFLKISEDEAEQAAARLKRQGAQEFVQRIMVRVQDVLSVMEVDELAVVARAFATEVKRLEEE